MPKEDTQFKPGQGGRVPGVQNHLTRTVKETVLIVFNKIQGHPKHNLEAFAKKYPRDFYNIAAKLIPTEVTGAFGLTLIPNEHKVTIENYGNGAGEIQDAEF